MSRVQEYESLIRQELEILGCNKQLTDEQLKRRDKRSSTITDSIDNYEIELLSTYFYSVISRTISVRKRKVVVSPCFDDKGNEVGLNRLSNKIENGYSLNSNLSKYVFDIDQSRNNDPMLNEWRIFHFHLPEEDGGGLFVERSKDLLFAFVDDSQVIYLDIQSHPDPNSTDLYEPWIDVEIISKAEEYYPGILDKYYVGDGRTPLTTDQRKNLRRRNGNTNIITNLGREYTILGYGTVSSGHPVEAIIRSDMALKLVGNSQDKRSMSFDSNYELVET